MEAQGLNIPDVTRKQSELQFSELKARSLPPVRQSFIYSGVWCEKVKTLSMVQEIFSSIWLPIHQDLEKEFSWKHIFRQNCRQVAKCNQIVAKKLTNLLLALSGVVKDKFHVKIYQKLRIFFFFQKKNILSASEIL